MEAKQLVEMIKGHSGPLPKPRFVIDEYAEVVSKLSPKLESQDIEQLVALGALIRRRSTLLVPALNWDDASRVLGDGRPVV